MSRFNESIDHLHELYVEENLIYVADSEDGLEILQIGIIPDNPSGAFDLVVVLTGTIVLAGIVILVIWQKVK